MAIILFAASSNTQSGWQYIITSIIISLLIIAIILPAKSLKSVTLNKYLPSRLYTGRDTSVDIVVTNHSNKDKSFFDIVDYPIITEHEIFSEANSYNLITLLIKYLHKMFSKKDYKVNCFLKNLPAQDVVEFKYNFIPQKRGIFAVGELIITNSFPLGLFGFSKSTIPEGSVVVYPRILDIRGGWVNRIANKSIVSELSYSYMPTSIPGTTRGLRDYIPGDSPRHIHWPSSAKANKLLVREFEIESTGYVFIILDACPEYDDPEYFELAVTTVASLLNACHAEGLLTRFAAQDDAYDYLNDIRDDDWKSQLEILARVQPVSNKSACKLIDALNQSIMTAETRFNPTFVLVSHAYKANMSANRDNIVTISVSQKRDPIANYTVTSEQDLRYI